MPANLLFMTACHRLPKRLATDTAPAPGAFKLKLVYPAAPLPGRKFRDAGQSERTTGAQEMALEAVSASTAALLSAAAYSLTLHV